VYEDDEGRLQNAHVALTRGRQLVSDGQATQNALGRMINRVVILKRHLNLMYCSYISTFVFSVVSFVERLVRLLAAVNLIAEETIILCVGGMLG
jgi:hypothetical protein